MKLFTLATFITLATAASSTAVASHLDNQWNTRQDDDSLTTSTTTTTTTSQPISRFNRRLSTVESWPLTSSLLSSRSVSSSSSLWNFLSTKQKRRTVLSDSKPLKSFKGKRSVKKDNGRTKRSKACKSRKKLPGSSTGSSIQSSTLLDNSTNKNDDSNTLKHVLPLSAVPAGAGVVTTGSSSSGNNDTLSDPSSSSSSSSGSTNSTTDDNNNNGTTTTGNLLYTGKKSTSMLMTGYWADWTSDLLPPEKIDFSKFDIVNYAFAIPTQDSNLNFPTDSSKILLKRFVHAAHKANTKAILSIGGWAGSQFFSPTMKTPLTRSTLIQNILQIYTTYELDGIDLDWEYPGKSDGENQSDPNDAVNFQIFLQEIRQALPNDALLTAAVSFYPWTGSDGQPVSSVAKAAAVLDFILIMNYDVWGSSTDPGPNSPLADLCGSSTHPGMNAAAGVKHWAAAGMPRNKILLGIPAYGYINTSVKTQLRARQINHHQEEEDKEEAHLSRRSHDNYRRRQRKPSSSDVPSGKVGRYDARHNRRALVSADGQSGSGQINFSMLIKQGVLKKSSTDGTFIASAGFTKYWDDCSDTPFLSNGEIVVTYDDTVSLWDKGAFASQAGIAGLTMWSIDGDTDSSDLVNAALSGLSQGGSLPSK